jgi:hypothetical protein
MQLRETTFTLSASPLDAGLCMMKIKVLAQVSQIHKEELHFTLLTDRASDLVPHQRHHIFTIPTHIHIRSRVVDGSPFPSGKIRHSASGTERRCVRGYFVNIIEFNSFFLKSI